MKASLGLMWVGTILGTLLLSVNQILTYTPLSYIACLLAYVLVLVVNIRLSSPPKFV